MKTPDIRFVDSAGASIAYQVYGEGPEVICVPGFVTNLEYQWQFDLTRRFHTRLGSFARVVQLDRRGCGLSERLSPRDLPPLEVLVGDICAVQDAAGFGPATVLAWADGAMQAMLFAATHPDRVTRLILFGAAACGTAKDGYPWQWTEEEWEAYFEHVAREWGTTEYFAEHARRWIPTVARDPELVRQLTSFFRLAANGSGVVTLERIMSQTDVRNVLPSIQAPTLLLHFLDDGAEDVEQSRYIARQIPDANCIELPGADPIPWAGNQEGVLDAIEEFLTGRRAASESDRVLATVMFTDIADSTSTAARLGDGEWRSQLDEHNRRARRVIGDHRGVFVNTTGDGVVARFDGPARSVRCALDLRDAIRPLDLQLRCGCHTGEIELRDDDIAGLAVHVGARVAAAALPDEVWVSSIVRDLTAGSGLVFEDAGEHELKGLSDRWRLFRALA